MRLFDYLKSDEKKSSIDLTDYKFLSDNHIRIENGRPTNANNKGAWRGIRIKSPNNCTFYVTIYNMNGNHPVWGDNIQMAEKQMKIVNESIDKIILRGFGTDAMGASFADYGMTLHKVGGTIEKITLHMHDRNIDIVYEKAINKVQVEPQSHNADFDDFKAFTHKWYTNMTQNERVRIATQTDAMNNKGVYAYQDGNLIGAISFFELALVIMPNNDDALKNLKRCYDKMFIQQPIMAFSSQRIPISELTIKIEGVKRKLDYLREIEKILTESGLSELQRILNN